MEDVEMLGVFLLSFGAACVNMNILASQEARQILESNPAGWYPAARYNDMLSALSARYEQFEPIKERIGAEMMRLWYEQGPGQSLIRSGVDFLKFQTGSGGYQSVVRGPAGKTGGFALELLDEGEGLARVRSSTPFDRTMERGILLGGMKLTGDLAYVDVSNKQDSSIFEIEFHG